MAKSPPLPPFILDHLPAGTRLGLAVSGGADSVALLRLAHLLAPQEGWILSVLHVAYGLRGDESAGDAAFVQALAAELGLPCTVHPAPLQPDQPGLEDAARQARYRWFAQQLQTGSLHAIATGHTLEDQAETVLGKLLRGAWTAGLAGIHPVVRACDLPGAEPEAGGGLLVRPLLGTRREALRTWLVSLGQSWREDLSNQDLRFTRNRLRHEALPVLAGIQPEASEQVAQIAILARDEEQYWQGEVARLLPGLLLPGKPVRGGGRAVSTTPGEQSLAMEVQRVQPLPTAVQRRLLRAVAARLGASLNFSETARALSLLAERPSSGTRREQISPAFRLERTARELRFVQEPLVAKAAATQVVEIAVPGSGEGFGVRLRLDHPGDAPQPFATLRTAKPGDRVQLRYSSGAPKRIKDLLERMAVPPDDRPTWPLLEWQGDIVWVRGAQIERPAATASLSVTEEK